MSHRGFVVPPRKKKDIADLATMVRRHFSMIIRGDWVPVDQVLEILPTFLPGFEFEVCDRAELGNDHGRTYPDTPLIQLRQDVYEGLCRGNGRDRFTAAHELGHLFLHGKLGMARVILPSMDIKIYCDSEWQANTFASYFLIDEAALQTCRSLDEVVTRFGVSSQAAEVRFKK